MKGIAISALWLGFMICANWYYSMSGEYASEEWIIILLGLTVLILLFGD